MMMHKKLQKVLAVALMTSFFSTSFVMGVSEAAPLRHAGGQRHAQMQQVRPVQKSSSYHARPQMRQGAPRKHIRPMERSSSRQGYGHYKNASRHQGPAMRRNNPGYQGSAMHKNVPGHQGTTMNRNSSRHSSTVMHKSGSIHHGPVMRKGFPHREEYPTMHRGRPIHDGPVVIQQQYPVPPPPYRYPNDYYRRSHSDEWLGALIVGGIIGAIIANNSHRKANHVEYVYAE